MHRVDGRSERTRLLGFGHLGMQMRPVAGSEHHDNPDELVGFAGYFFKPVDPNAAVSALAALQR